MKDAKFLHVHINTSCCHIKPVSTGDFGAGDRYMVLFVRLKDLGEETWSAILKALNNNTPITLTMISENTKEKLIFGELAKHTSSVRFNEDIREWSRRAWQYSLEDKPYLTASVSFADKRIVVHFILGIEQ